MVRVGNKVQMYRMLAAGEFGNTINQYFSVDEWKASAEYHQFKLWGVRSLIPGGPCRLYTFHEEVESTVKQFGCPCNISIMVDAVTRVLMWADVYDSPTGLMVRAIEFPSRGASWRVCMPRYGVERKGIAARQLLRKHLNASSLADLESLIERFPGHVIELSALDRCIGMIPSRNAVIWEVRDY